VQPTPGYAVPPTPALPAQPTPALLVPPTQAVPVQPKPQRTWITVLVVALLVSACGAGAFFVLVVRPSTAPSAKAAASTAHKTTATSAPVMEASAKPPPAASSAPVEAKSTLVDYHDPGGAFDTTFDCTPMYKHIPRRMESGAEMERSLVSCDSRRGFTSVSVTDALSGDTMGCGLTNRMSEEYILKAMNCSALSHEDLKVDRFEGVITKVDCPQQGLKGDMRFYCDPTAIPAGRARGIVAEFLRFQSDWNDAEASRFWASFHPHSLPDP
jgi:hypothetical protein